MIQFCIAFIGVEQTGALFRAVLRMGVLLVALGGQINYATTPLTFLHP